MSSQNEILKMTKDQVNQYLIKNWNDYSKVKNALEHPEIDINYEYTLTRSDKVRPAFKPYNRTPIINLLENIFKNVFVGLLKDGGVNDDRLNNHLKILKLMVKDSEPWDFTRPYRYNHRYINEHEEELLFSGVRRKTRERFQELMYRGFTIQSLFKDDKLIKELFEIGYEKYNYLDKTWDEDTKKLIKERYKKVKEVIYPHLGFGPLPKPPPPKPPQKKSSPVWTIILLSVAGFLIVSGGGYYGRKKYLNYKKKT